MRAFATKLTWALAVFTVLAFVTAGTLPVTKLGTTDFLPRKDHWIGYNSKDIPYTLNDGTPYTLPTDSYIMWGGLASDYSDNDVWVTQDAVNWQMIGGKSATANSTRPMSSYIFHVGQAECQDFVTDRLYITGGEIGQLTLNVGYTSADGGATWTAFTMGTNRSYSNCLVDSTSKLYVLNGLLNYYRTGPGSEKRQPNNEVWTSTNFGNTWRQLNNATYSQRMAASVAISIKKGPKENTDVIYVLGGLSLNATDGTEIGLNDVWVSTTSGTSWIRATPAGQFPIHIDTTLIVSRSGMLMLVGGRNTDWDESPDLWGSMDGGKNWGKLTPSASSGYTGRIFPAAMFTRDGRLLITGGEYHGQLLSDIYQSNSSLEADLPGTAVLIGLNPNIWNPSRLCLGWLPCASPLEATRLGFGPWTSRAHSGATVVRKSVTLAVFQNSTGTYPNMTFPIGSMILFGGMNSQGDNDIWASTDGGSNSWYLVGGRSTQGGRKVNSQKPDSSFVLRDGQAVCSNYIGDRFFVAGGDPGPSELSYTSLDSGATWRLNTGKNFTHRSWSTCAFDRKNNIYLVAGILDYDRAGSDNRDPSNDVWRSTDNGMNWEHVVRQGSFVPRGAHAFAIGYAQGPNADTDLLYIAGGITDIVARDSLNDVYVSTDGGINWICTTTKAAWVKRADLAMTVSTAGVLIVSGGRTDGDDVHDEFYVFNDIWVSFDGGYNWYMLEESAFTPRRLQSIFVNNFGKLVVIGGKGSANNPESYVRDIFRTTYGDFNVPSSLVPLLHKDDIAVVKYNPKCAGYFVKLGQDCPNYNPDDPDNPDFDPESNGGLSTGAIAGIVILIIVVVLATCGWSFYSIRVHGELRIPFTDKACNCCNNALKEDQLADDGYALHKGTGKLKNSLNGSLHHRLIDE